MSCEFLINWKGSGSKITLKDCLEGNGKPARTLSLNIQPPYKYPNHFNFTKTKANSPLPVITMSKTVFFKISYAVNTLISAPLSAVHKPQTANET